MNINIVDLDNIMHIGTKAGKMGKFNTNALPTGGLYRLFGLMKSTGVLSSPEENKMIVVYDKGVGVRRSLLPSYKVSRKEYKTEVDLIKDKAVQLQKEIAIDTLKKAGFIVLGSDEVEADDLMFNIILNYAYNPNQPLTKDTQITLHSSDSDWLGALGVTSNIYFNCTNSNSQKISSIKSYGDYQRAFGTAIEYHYVWKAIYGDISDGYAGHRDPTLLTLSSKTINNSNFWNYTYWEELVKVNYPKAPQEVLDHMLLHLKLAMPMYNQDTFNFDYVSKLKDIVIDKEVIRNQLEILRIKILESHVGKLQPYGETQKEGMRNLKRFYIGKYKDVFDYYSTMEYEPKISTEAVDRAFGMTTIV